MAELAEPVTGEQDGGRGGLAAAVLTDALVREAVGLAAVVAVLVAVDPGMRAAARRLAARVFRRRPDMRKAAVEQQVAEFMREVSGFEKGCGCG